MDFYLNHAIEKTKELIGQIDEMQIPTELDGSVGDHLRGYLEALKQRAIGLHDSIDPNSESEDDPNLFA